MYTDPYEVLGVSRNASDSRFSGIVTETARRSASAVSPTV